MRIINEAIINPSFLFIEDQPRIRRYGLLNLLESQEWDLNPHYSGDITRKPLFFLPTRNMSVASSEIYAIPSLKSKFISLEWSFL
jgi:hypothetical protein